MKLLTKEIEKRIPKLDSTEITAIHEKRIAVKYFTPDSHWTWYAFEGERDDTGDVIFFGVVDGFEIEMGYFSLRELAAVRGPRGLPVERDLYFGTPKVSEVSELSSWAKQFN